MALVDVITAATLGALLIATIWRPPVAYAAAVSTFALEQWAQGSGSFFSQHGSLLNYTVGVIVLSGIISALAQGRKPLAYIELTYAGIVALLATCLLSAIWSVNTAQTIAVFKYTVPYLLTYSLALPLVFSEERDFRVAIVALAVVGLFLVPALTFGTSVHAWGRTIESAVTVVDRYGRSHSRLSPLAVSSYAGVIGLVCLTAHLQKTSHVLRLVGWAVLPMAMYLIIRSGSRGQFIATVVAGLAVIKFGYPGMKVTRLLGLSLAIVVLMASAFVMRDVFGGNRFNLRIGADDYIGTRGVYCGIMLEEWMRGSPINVMFGLGSSSSWHFLGTYPHVQVVELLTELGLFGLTLGGAIVASVLYSIWRILHYTKRDLKQRGAAVAFMAITALHVILSFKQGSFLTNYAMFFNFAILGRFAAVLSRSSSQAASRNRQEWMRRWQAAQETIPPQVTSA